MKKLKYILYSLLVATFLFVACDDETEDFDYKHHEVTVDDIDTVLFSTNHLMLLLDGVSELDLDLSLIKYVESVNTLGDTTELEHKAVSSRIPEGGVKYFYQYEGEDPVEIGSSAYVGDVNTQKDSVYVFASVFGTDTRKTKIALKKYEIDEALHTEKTIPVIFHFFTAGDIENKFESQYSPGQILAKIDEINIPFQRLANKSPNGFNTKIKFVPAEYAPDGAKLEAPGLNYVIMNKETAEEEYSEMVGEESFLGFIENTSDYVTRKGAFWDYTKYLNIWVIDSEWSVAAQCEPKHVLTGHPLIGLTMEEVDEGTQIDYEAMDCGIAIKQDYFTNPSFSITQRIGRWLGLLPTEILYIFPERPDYCDDTFAYKSYYSSKETKISYSGFEYKSTNIMDNASTSSTVTYEQGKRILHVMNYCPARRVIWESAENSGN